ncbi:MAG: hypothetical protein DHS20C18_40340 [Saprospiraceae bacterium]|nr:MAG: hypothetical protein DHS20C18_40340 [Saprospiraceae bacterium]
MGGYFMDSYFRKDQHDIYIFSGEFKKQDCNECREALTVNLKDIKVSTDGGTFDPLTRFKVGDVTIAQPTSNPQIDLQSYQFFPNYPGANPNWNFQWIFNGVDTVYTSSPIYRFPNLEEQVVSLTVTNPFDFCVSTWEYTVDLWQGQPECPYITFNYLNSPEGEVGFFLSILDQDIVSSSWDFGDGDQGVFDSQSLVSHTYDTPDSYEVCTEVTYLNNCTDSFCSPVQSHQGAGCAMGFNYLPLLLPDSVFYLLSTVELEWVSEDNKVYSSSVTDVVQNPESFFEIIAIEPYEVDLDGDKTMKITATLSLTLFNKDNPIESIQLQCDELVFAVGYPG